MQDIADQLGVTKVSVSKAINNQPGIGDALRKKILLTAKQLGYTKIKRETEKQSYKFAWICPKRFFLEDETFYSTIYYYINKRCMEKGYSIVCFVINGKEELDGELPQRMISESFDGIFIAGEFHHDYLQKLKTVGGVKLAIDFCMPNLGIDSIVSDNFSTGQEVTAYLIQKGHQRIGFVGNIHNSSSICDRYFGYLKALRLNGLEVREDWHFANNDEVTGQYTLDFALPEDLPTAFVCHCDKAAFTLMQKLEGLGVRVPEDVSVISFDNTSICDLISPRLTSVDIDRKQIALYSIDQMLYRIGHSQSLPRKIYLGCRLIERNSVLDIRPVSGND